MPPLLALALWLILLVMLLRYDPARDPNTSWTTWIAVAWLAIAASRLPSQWLQLQTDSASAAMQEGNGFDRIVLSALMAMAIWILVARRFKWGEFFLRHWTLMALLAFALFSAFWSDFPGITAKRWFRDLGNYFVVLVALTDPHPAESVRTILRRVAYLLIPLSIVLTKYFPELGKQYDTWSGMGYYIGVATSKNMLGALCLVSAVFFFWDSVSRWPERRQKRTKRILWINALFLAMTARMTQLAHSTTSDVCIALGCLVILAAHMKFFRRRPGVIKFLVPATFVLYLVIDFGVGLGGSLAQALGKDATLTDRTKIWAFLLNMHTNPIIGTGYQSFWLGDRLMDFWQNSGLGHLNEAHNGYLEIYLELGLIGCVLTVGFLIASYRSICTRFSRQSELATLGIAMWLVLVFYNMSEAAFEGGLLYSVFLFGALTQSRRLTARSKSAVKLRDTGVEAVPGTLATTYPEHDLEPSLSSVQAGHRWLNS